MKPASPIRSALAWLVALAPATVALAVTASWYRTFVADDAFISLRYSRRLLEGHGLTWDDFHPVEGYSNLAWTLAVAAMGACGVELVLAARVLGVVCTVAVFAALAWAYRPEEEGPVAAGLPAFLLAIAGPFSVWAVGGLEQPMVAAALAWSLALALPLFDGTATSRTPWAAGAALALLVLSRPDSPLFVAGLAGGLVLSRGLRAEGWRLAGLLLVLPVAAWLGQTAFRWAYYGELVPNTAVIKAAPMVYADQGWRYVTGGLTAFWPLLGVALPGAACAFHGTRRAFVGALLGTGAVFLAYLATVGGDIFPAWRHFVPVLVLLAFVAAEGIRRLGAAPRAVQGGLALVACGLGWLLLQQHVEGPRYRKAARERWEWDHKLVGELLDAAFRDQQPLYAMNAAGALAYYANLPAIDMLGLNDHHIARAPRREGWPLAHDRGDGAYVLDRQTDIIQSQLNGKGLGYISGTEIAKDPRLRTDYTEVRLQARKGDSWLTIPLYVRTWGRIGMRREGDRIEVPGWMVQGTVGRLVDGELVAFVPGRSRPKLVLPVEPGVYDVTVEGAAVEVAAPGCVASELSIELSPPPASFRAIRVERRGDCPPPPE